MDGDSTASRTVNDRAGGECGRRLSPPARVSGVVSQKKCLLTQMAVGEHES